jgi:hypothetical protein
MPIDLTFQYHASQRVHFMEGGLVERWRSIYGDMFDEEDYRLAVNQRQNGNHFFEWLAAVLLRESTGYRSLIEKYESANHAEKLATFRKTVDRGTFEFAMSHRAGLPDLFVYGPLSTNWFFCEVKGGRDVLSARQKELHAKLEQVSKTVVRILWFKKIE